MPLYHNMLLEYQLLINETNLTTFLNANLRFQQRNAVPSTCFPSFPNKTNNPPSPVSYPSPKLSPKYLYPPAKKLPKNRKYGTSRRESTRRRRARGGVIRQYSITPPPKSSYPSYLRGEFYLMLDIYQTL